jgi:hypothetical protein
MLNQTEMAYKLFYDISDVIIAKYRYQIKDTRTPVYQLRQYEKFYYAGRAMKQRMNRRIKRVEEQLDGK